MVVVCARANDGTPSSRTVDKRIRGSIPFPLRFKVKAANTSRRSRLLAVVELASQRSAVTAGARAQRETLIWVGICRAEKRSAFRHPWRRGKMAEGAPLFRPTALRHSWRARLDESRSDTWAPYPRILTGDGLSSM